MRPYTVVYSDKTFSLSFSDANNCLVISLKDQSKDFGSVQVMFPSTSSNYDLMRDALRNATEAFNNVFQAAITPMTEQEKELTLEEMSF